MNGNSNIINMNGLNNTQQASAATMIQNPNFSNPLLPQQQDQQVDQSQHQLFSQSAQPLHFAGQQQRPGMNPATGQINGQFSGQMNTQMGTQMGTQMNGQLNGQINTQINGGISANASQIGNQQLMAQQQMQQQAQQQAQHQVQQPRPGMQRAATLQSVNAPIQMTNNKIQYNPNAMVAAPNSAPLPIRTPSNSNSSGHTPQMGSQPQPMQFNLQVPSSVSKMGGIPSETPVVQQQPTPQSQPRIGPPPISHSKSAQMGRILGSSQSPDQKQMLSNAASQFLRNDVEVNELQARINRRNLGNAGIIRVLDLIDQISNDSIENLKSKEYWQRVLFACFVPTSILRYKTAQVNPTSDSFFGMHPNSLDADSDDPRIQNTMLSNFSSGRTKSRQFELNVLTAPNFFISAISNGNVAKFSLHLPGIKFQVMNNGSIFLISGILLNYIYNDGSSSTVQGSCKILMNKEFKIEWIDCNLKNYQPSVNISCLQSKWGNYVDSKEKSNIDFVDYVSNTSEASKLASSSGINENAMRVMQIGETMSSLRSLMGFSSANNINSPIKAMELFMNSRNHKSAFPQIAKPNSQNPKQSVSSPSPRTIQADDPKVTINKRRASSTNSNAGSPFSMERKSLTNKRRK